MGVLETETVKTERRNKIRKIILQSIATAGILSVALVAPNALQALKVFGYKPHRRQREVINKSRDRLLKQGLIKWTKRGFLQLTDKGKTYLHTLERRNYRLPRPKYWDKKWRILIFDIPDYRKGLRDKVRNTLRAVGFIQLQKSVWVYPYDCEDFITLLKTDFKIGKDLLYIIADKIENDARIKNRFDL